MDESVTVTLVANAGVLLTYHGRKILIDGLYMVLDSAFSDLPTDTIQSLRLNRAPFDGVDYILFTHEHSDHFSAAMVQAYLQKHSARGVLLPPVRTEEQKALTAMLSKRGIPFVASDKVRDAISPEPGIKVLPIRTRHVDRHFWETPHYALLVTLGEKNFLFTGDADYTSETFPGLPPLRAAFLNPLFFRAVSTKTFFHGELPTDTYCVYHIPFAERDVYDIRRTVQKCLEQHPIPDKHVYVLQDAGQQIIL